MPRVESEIVQKYQGQAYRALAVHVGKEVQNAVLSDVKTKITFPMLIDIDETVVRAYNRLGNGKAVFPLAYLIDKGGIIRKIYAHVAPEIATVQADVEALLAEEAPPPE